MSGSGLDFCDRGGGASGVNVRKPRRPLESDVQRIVTEDLRRDTTPFGFLTKHRSGARPAQRGLNERLSRKFCRALTAWQLFLLAARSAGAAIEH